MPTHNKGTSVHCAVTLWLWQDIRCVELACSWSGSERSGSLQGPRLLHKTCAKHSSRASGLEVRKTRARNLETCGRGEGEGGRGREGKEVQVGRWPADRGGPGSKLGTFNLGYFCVKNRKKLREKKTQKKQNEWA